MNLIITHCPHELLSRPLFGAIINANIPIDKHLQIINYQLSLFFTSVENPFSYRLLNMTEYNGSMHIYNATK